MRDAGCGMRDAGYGKFNQRSVQMGRTNSSDDMHNDGIFRQSSIPIWRHEEI